MCCSDFGVHEARVQRGVTRLGAELGNIDSFFVLGPDQQGQLNGLIRELKGGSVRHGEVQESGCKNFALKPPRSLPPVPAFELDQHGFLGVEAVFGLIEDNRIRPLQYLLRDLPATFGWQAVHHLDPLSGTL